jgi:hypothetical protein
VVPKALVLAYAVHESGYREVIGLDVGECETEAFWRSFLRGLVERGLGGVQQVVSDAHAGLKKAIAQTLDCPWQPCPAPSTSCAKRSGARARRHAPAVPPPLDDGAPSRAGLFLGPRALPTREIDLTEAYTDAEAREEHSACRRDPAHADALGRGNSRSRSGEGGTEEAL